MYAFSLEEQICVRILIGRAKLCTHAHWQSKFMYGFSLTEQIVYAFSLADQVCVWILIGGASLCTDSH